jgi:ligand-binding sensor domain-containing protein
MQGDRYKFICVARVISLVLFFYLLIVVNGNAQGTWTVYTAPPLVSSNVRAIAIDGSGNKWFGTNGGVSRFDGAIWNNYTTPNLVSNNVRAITVDGTNIWFATNGGVSKFDGAAWTVYTNASTAGGLVDNDVYSIAIDGLGNKWFATNGGVSKFDGGWTIYTNASTAGGLPSNNVYAVAIDGLGNKWFGTNAGVSKFDGAIWTIYTTLDGLAHNNVNAVAVDGAGDKWFGTNGGVSSFDGTTWTNYTNANTSGGLVSNNVSAIAFDAAGNMWFGTNGGVSKFDGAAWTVYTNASTGGGLVGDNVKAVAIDAVGHKWFGTSSGVSEFSTPPDAPTLSLPSDEATDISTSPTLIWNISVGATSYTLQVSLVSDFSSFVFNQNVGNVMNKQISGCLEATKYYWKVNAANLEGTSVWSSVWNFITFASVIPPQKKPYQVPCRDTMVAALGCMFYGIFRIIKKDA